MVRVRLDTLLHQRGHFGSRSRAAAAVQAGEVRVGDRAIPTTKPGQMVDDDVALTLTPRGPSFVSRGGVKLANALDALAIDVQGRHGLDVGASTGGFTDCLLQRGAEHVVALDVAGDELDGALRADARVTALDRVNARELAPGDLPYAPDLIVADVSFISLTKVLPAVLTCAAPRFDALAMVKPQFEVGRERLGGGGVVRDAADRRWSLARVARAARDEAGAAVLGFASSGLPGPKGNRETFVWLAEGGRTGALDDDALVAVAAAADAEGDDAEVRS